jgi:tetratricopeptide (TPR) repeat protein
VTVEGGAVKARLEGATAVPRTLRTLIAARVGRLGAAERATLQAAAVLGDPVPLEVVAAILGQSVAQVDRSVAALAARDLLRATGAAQASFASPMHAEIVLDTIPAAARRDLHASAAAAYASAFGDSGFEHAERIAEHHYQSGDRDAAATFSAQAARARARLGQLEPAIVLMGRALELCEFDRREPAELARWLETLAEAVTRVRSARDLGAVAARALARIDAAGDIAQRVLARADLARALGAVHLFGDAHAHLAQAFVLAGDVPLLLARALAAELEIGVRSGDFARAAQAGDRLQVLDVPIAPRAWLAMAQARAATGDNAALEAVDAAERLGDPTDLVLASEREKQRVLVHIYCRDFEKAVAASARAVEFARAAGLRFETAAALHNLGDAARRLGDLPRAYASLRESLETAEEAGHERLVSLNRVHLAWLDGVGGKEGAEAELRELVRYADARGYRTDALEGRYLLAALQQRRGDAEGARRALVEVRAEALALGNQLVAEDAREALGDAS